MSARQPTVVTDARIEAFLSSMVEEEHLTGAVLVMKQGRVVHRAAYGMATADKPNTVKTAFHVASVTKQFTAAAVLQLNSRGEIDLTASINRYLPEHVRSARWDRVTVHHLLSHTGGVPDYGLERDYYQVVDGFCLGDTVEGMILEAGGRELDFEPGTRFTYSNLGYTLLGLIVEHHTATPFEIYLKDNVLAPMGMHDSRLHVVGHRPVPDEAAGFRWSEEDGRHVPDDVVSLPVTAPDGGLVTTLSDMAKWAPVYLGCEQTILSPALVERMTTPVMIAPDPPILAFDESRTPQTYGYGLFVGENLVGHPGYIVGFRSSFVVDRRNEIVVAVFTNNTANDPIKISTGLLALVR